MERFCPDCGKPLDSTKPHQQRCLECGIEHSKQIARESKKRRMERKKMEKLSAAAKLSPQNSENQPAKEAKPFPTCDSYCRGCIHSSKTGDRYSCMYIFHKDKMRGCPPGKGCTKRETKRGKPVSEAPAACPETPEPKEENHAETVG